MIDKHLLKLRARDAISAEEEAFIRGGVSGSAKVQRDTVVVRAFEPIHTSSILVSGIACRFKDLGNGRRQITELHVPGDFTDVHGFSLKYLDHDILAVTNCQFALVPHAHLQEMTEHQPHLTRVYWFGTNLDAAIHREWELSLGRRDATARMAHLFCELYVRLEIVGLVRQGAYDLPLTQVELSDCLGITPVHTNRTLQQLRSDGLVEFRSGQVILHDLAALKAIADFDPRYLYLRRMPH